MQYLRKCSLRSCAFCPVLTLNFERLRYNQMRRQNPPQSSLEQAQALERWLRPAPLAVAYVVCATAAIVVVTLLLTTLASGNLLNPTRSTTAIFALLALGICALAWFQFQCRPHDFLSASFRVLANSRRRPIKVAAEHCVFKVMLRSGEILCADLAFHYPGRNHIPEVREFLVSHVRIALDRDSSMRNDPPNDSEVLDIVDRALEAVAAEFNIPVLYSKVLEVHRVRDEFSAPENIPVQPDRRRFATAGIG